MKWIGLDTKLISKLIICVSPLFNEFLIKLLSVWVCYDSPLPRGADWISNIVQCCQLKASKGGKVSIRLVIISSYQKVTFVLSFTIFFWNIVLHKSSYSEFVNKFKREPYTRSSYSEFVNKFKRIAYDSELYLQGWFQKETFMKLIEDICKIYY